MKKSDAPNTNHPNANTRAGTGKRGRKQAAATVRELPGWPLARLDSIYGDTRVRSIAVDVETRLDRDAALVAGFDPDGAAEMPFHLFKVQAVTVFVAYFPTHDDVLPVDFAIRSYTDEQFPERDLIAVLVAEIGRVQTWYGFAWERHEMPVLLSRGAVHGLDLSTILVPRGSADQLTAIMLDTARMDDLCAGLNIPAEPLGGTPRTGCSLAGEARATGLWLLSTFTYAKSMVVGELCWERLAGWINRQPAFDHLLPFVTASYLPPEEPPSPAPQA